MSAQRAEPGSLLELYRELIALRRELSGPLAMLPTPRRGSSPTRAGGTWSR